MPIYVIDKIKQKNGNTFKIIDAEDVDFHDEEMLETLAESGIVTPASDGAAVYTDSTGKVFVL